MIANLALLGVFFFLLWLLSLFYRDASIIDIFWGPAFVLVTWQTYALSGVPTLRSYALLVMVTIWGLRLSGYLAWRNWGKPEDYRYREMRTKWHGWFPLISLTTVFALQGLLVWVVAFPIQVGLSRPPTWHTAATLGVLVWSAGFLCESIGDYQMARFKADPDNHGRVMDRGLWRYTRHPNYFGDFLVWWGTYLVAVEPGTWWWTLVGPMTMSILLLRVSGVQLLEKSLRRRIDGYKQYVRDTSSFVPMPPRNRS